MESFLKQHSQLVNKFLSLYKIKFYYCVHNSKILVSLLSKINPTAPSIPVYLLSISVAHLIYQTFLINLEIYVKSLRPRETNLNVILEKI